MEFDFARAAATASADLQAANEMAAILLERVSASEPEAGAWTGDMLAKCFLLGAWKASASTNHPLSDSEFAHLLRWFADTIETIGG